MIETTHGPEVWPPEKRGTVQMLASGQCHPQLEGLQGTCPPKQSIAEWAVVALDVMDDMSLAVIRLNNKQSDSCPVSSWTKNVFSQTPFKLLAF